MDDNFNIAIAKSHIYFIELTISSFKNYYSLVEENLQKHHKTLLQKHTEITIKFEAENYQGEDLDNLYSSASEALNEVEIEFIQRFRKSIIIQLYSLVETELKSFCDAHASINLKEYKVSDLKGHNDLDKIKKYLTNSAGIKVGDYKLWPFINDLRKLRNSIVHHDGLININDSDFNCIKKFSNGNFSVKGHSTDYIIRLKQPEFMKLCIDNVGEFLVAIMDR